MSVPIGLQYGGNAGSIQVQGNGQGTRTTTELIDTTVGLRVEPNQTLALVGGDIALLGGTLKTAGGRIELGSVAGGGLVNLTPTIKGWALGYEGVPTFGDIQLSQQATVDASGAGGGDIQVRGRQVMLQDGSEIEVSTLGSEPGGTLAVTASESVELIGTTADDQFPSGLFTSVQPGATGSGGNLTLETGRLSVSDGAFVSASTFGIGHAGDLTIKTGRLSIRDGANVLVTTSGSGNAGKLLVQARDEVEVVGAGSYLSADVLLYATGDGGNLTVETGRLNVSDGAVVSADTYGSGNAGNLLVQARDEVEVVGAGSYLSADVLLYATGDGGNLTLEIGRLIVQDGAQIAAGTFGAGRAGTLEVKARESVELIGTTADGQLPSGLFTSVESGSTGAGGNLTVETGRLIIRDGATVQTGTSGEGSAGTLAVSASESVELIGASADGEVVSALSTRSDPGATGAGGNLSVETGRLIVKDGAQVSADTSGEGLAGNLTVNASEFVELMGASADGQFSSALSTSVESGATGAGGKLTLETERLIVRDGAQVSASTSGEGSAGSLTVNASEFVEVMGASADGQFSSGLFTSVQPGATGSGGNLTLETGRLIVRDGAGVTAGTLGSGAGGTLAVNASESVEVIGRSADGRVPSLLTALTSGTGSAGDLTIETGQLTVRDGAKVTVSSTGSGKAGDLQVQQARSIRLDNGDITATTASVNDGNITLRSHDLLLLRRNSQISTTAGIAGAGGNGGNITITAPFIVAVPEENSDITANANLGAGGFIQVTAQGVFGLERRSVLTPLSDITAFSQQNPELNGVVEINTPDVDPSRGLDTLPA